MTRVFVLCSIVALSTFIPLSESCKCRFEEEQQKFCDESFVGVVKVSDSIDQDGSSKIYPADVLEVFKNTGNPPITSKKVNISVGSTSCDVMLKPQETIVIGSSSTTEVFRPSLCGLFRLWNSDLDENDVKNFRSVYQEKCQCSERVPNSNGYITCM